jgi:hypothetical protein
MLTRVAIPVVVNRYIPPAAASQRFPSGPDVSPYIKYTVGSENVDWNPDVVTRAMYPEPRAAQMLPSGPEASADTPPPLTELTTYSTTLPAGVIRPRVP